MEERRKLERELADRWARCVANAHADVDTAIAIGTLPTLREADLALAAITPINRYRLLTVEEEQALADSLAAYRSGELLAALASATGPAGPDAVIEVAAVAVSPAASVADQVTGPIGPGNNTVAVRYTGRG